MNESTLANQVLSNIRQKMSEQNIAVFSLARVTGMSESHITGILKGRVGITLRTIERLARVFGVEAYTLLKGEND